MGRIKGGTLKYYWSVGLHGYEYSTNTFIMDYVTYADVLPGPYVKLAYLILSVGL